MIFEPQVLSRGQRLAWQLERSKERPRGAEVIPNTQNIFLNISRIDFTVHRRFFYQTFWVIVTPEFCDIYYFQKNIAFQKFSVFLLLIFFLLLLLYYLLLLLLSPLSLPPQKMSMTPITHSHKWRMEKTLHKYCQTLGTYRITRHSLQLYFYIIAAFSIFFVDAQKP